MIRTLNLDSEFIPVPRPEIEFEKIHFPAGEKQIRLNDKIDYSKVDRVIITHRYSAAYGDKLLMDIAIAKDALERKGIKSFNLVLAYFPHARQDRATEPNVSLTLRVFADFIDSLHFNYVHIYDPHSAEVKKYVRNVAIIDNHQFEQWAMMHINNLENKKPILVVPDAGAAQKGKSLFDRMHYKFHRISYCTKNRNPESGRLSGFSTDYHDYEGRPCIIIDDICDGGGTFIGLAKELKKKGAGNLYLAVSHGIFSKGPDPLLRYFKHIYTTNSYKRSKVHQTYFQADYKCHEYKIQL